MAKMLSKIKSKSTKYKKWSKVPTVEDYEKSFTDSPYHDLTQPARIKLKTLEGLFHEEGVENIVPEKAALPFYYLENLKAQFNRDKIFAAEKPTKHQKEIKSAFEFADEQLLEAFNEKKKDLQKAKEIMAKNMKAAQPAKLDQGNAPKQAKQSRFGDYYYNDYHYDGIGSHYLYNNNGYLSQFGHANSAGKFRGISGANQVNNNNYYLYYYYGEDDDGLYNEFDNDDYNGYRYNRKLRRNGDYERYRYGRTRYRDYGRRHRNLLENPENDGFMQDSSGYILIAALCISLMILFCIIGGIVYRHRYNKKRALKAVKMTAMKGVEVKADEEESIDIDS